MAAFLERLRRIGLWFRTATTHTLAALALLAVFCLTAFATLRLAIHGSEVTVPNLAGLSDADAAAALKSRGLNLSIENRFYATSVPVNHVLSQSPMPGSRVRSGWQIRVTESLGVQQVPVPDVTAQPSHAADLMLRRLQFDVGLVAHLPAPPPADVVLSQSPPPNVAGLDGPRVGLLVADDIAPPPTTAYVMPSLIGLTVGEANERLAVAGLHLASATQPRTSDIPESPTDASSSTPATVPAATDPAVPTFVRPLGPPRASALITSQTPLPGHRVSRAENIRVLVN
jgi:beta-lactam-binding protein with PASTA domain